MSVEPIKPELDLKVSEAAEQVFKVTPQTLNRWIREIRRDFKIVLGYDKAKAKWLKPSDINVLRQYVEGSLKSDSNDGNVDDRSSNERDDRSVDDVGDEGFTTFSKIADEADQELSKALAIRDKYVEDRALIIAQEFHPDTIARDIMAKAIDRIKTGSSESLGEVARGGMHRPFVRRGQAIDPIGSLSGTSPKLLGSSQA